MMTDVSPIAPPPLLMEAMQAMRRGDDRSALTVAGEALTSGQHDRAPYLAIASLAALRLREFATAVPMLRELLVRNPADGATAANLANALIELEQFDDAKAVAATIDSGAMQRIRGFLAQREGDLAAAAQAYRTALSADENDLSSWNNLGNVLADAGDHDAAIEAFECAISLAPANLPIYHNLARALREVDRSEARVRVLRDALKVAPDDYDTLLELGQAEARVDANDAAIAAFRKAIAVRDGFGDAHIELGVLYESLNYTDDLAELVASIDLASAPAEAAFVHAWDARRAGDFERAATLAQAIPETIHPMRRGHLIGGVADRLGDHDAAFAAFTQMNAAALTTSPPPEGPTFREEVEADIARWTDDWAARWQPVKSNDGWRDPVFLVGFPRSGTTLLDTMLMGQPSLSVLEERPMMARTLRLIREEEDLPTLSPSRIGELRAAYFDFAREAGWDDSRWLVDKHPLNMERVPLIHRLFPDAKIILAERHPYDVVLSCYMANFTLNQAMRSFTSLDEAALTYDAVFRAWERANALFPVDWRPVRYERLVENAEAELKPLIDWLGVAWTDSVARHTETAATRGRVRTASYSQIGEALYTRARYRWRGYAAHLMPVIPVLRPWAEKMGYDAD